MGLFADIQALINEHGSATIMKERLALMADKAKVLEEQIVQLQRKVAALEEDKRNLNSKLSAASRAEEFVEHRGALFKRKPEGGYHLAVYCPICHKPTGALDSDFTYGCTERCGWVGTFTPRDLEKIMKELPQ
jgi:hypothetical protein